MMDPTSDLQRAEKPPKRRCLQEKMTPLTINVSQAKWGGSQVLEESTNSSSWTSASSSSFIYTPDPDTSYTFGVPNPTTVKVAPPTPPLTTPLRRTRAEIARQRRYSQAEEALALTAQLTLQETSQTELQIRTLEQAASLLNSRLEDAQERSAKLRSLLNDRETDPATFESLKRERWMEEHRKALAEEESRAIHVQLASLTKGNNAVYESHVGSSRHQANLLRYLQSSNTRRPIHPIHTEATTVGERAARRITLGEASPARLRMSIGSRHARSLSMDQKPRDRSTSPLNFNPKVLKNLVSTADSPSLDMLTEDEDCDMSNEIHSFSTAAPVTPRHSSSVSPLSRKLKSTVREACGTATIHTPVAVKTRTTADILADLPPVALPVYAVDLLGDFEEQRTPTLKLSRDQAMRMSRDSRRSRDTAPRPSLAFSEWEVLSTTSSTIVDPFSATSSSSYIAPSTPRPLSKPLPPMIESSIGSEPSPCTTHQPIKTRHSSTEPILEPPPSPTPAPRHSVKSLSDSDNIPLPVPRRLARSRLSIGEPVVSPDVFNKHIRRPFSFGFFKQGGTTSPSRLLSVIPESAPSTTKRESSPLKRRLKMFF
ncbi:uncharacterized protein BT62DRAFT_995268 [Guyanagaster necrorhizus]|uniref:Uncharacterized protein n=1 Tax=Guyanagaster necrorhizus TaxID=856835 RepID=A0A9P7VQ24_9AGAR|nr:uncharacterized protein BT62DRAFT_995268 [Guyanagaster necrorhizus MCA 3950]KAG7444804.1 hypothetical protein BT62DRAFT_995268 [Guyanagaster necrorhizus MCA 3950]